ncbi:MAG TPA: ribosome silencing factor [Actinomycetota bacterium]|nr:ribosome silencing factor [Actinomycetota bacterium]
MTDSGERARLAARAASSKQGEATVILDLRDLLTITDYFVITSGTSDRQVKTVAEEIVRAMKEHGVRPVREEGDAQAGWILLDYVDFVVHVFRQEERDYYRLENLWADAPRLAWEEEAKASSG